MEYAVYLFLETKEVNSVLCSEYKPDPTCPPLDFENLQLQPTVVWPKAVPRGSPYLQSGALPRGGRHAHAGFWCEHRLHFSNVELLTGRRAASQL